MVFDSKYLTRRWRSLNGNPPRSLESDEELLWRGKIGQNLSNIHTPQAIQGSTFSIEESTEADLAIELHNFDFGKWRWECFKLSYKTSANLLSTHLFFPLLAATHLAFTSADSVSELSKSDLEEAVDNVARAGRRTQAIFIRQTFSRPRINTSLARISAMLNFTDTIPPIQDDFERSTDVDTNIDEGIDTSSTSQKVSQLSDINSPRHTVQELETAFKKGKRKFESPSLSPGPKFIADAEGSTTEPESDNNNDDKMSVNVEETAGANNAGAFSPPPIAKKNRSSATDTNDTVRPTTSHSAVPARKIGVRQPIKRGGKRF
ncbi:hypothetical protein Clacol_003262 [Clathrus columnatus]|uniref:Uncharacterized protein n=1 Tax=Clathrus columnatus TaxID=1419009 RepID=A0AAV5AAT0_9AGAM|nr:hypothetical protein Clacol_003262 [Clathrus columnatus]